MLEQNIIHTEERDYEMAQLEAAAKARDEQAFVTAQKTVDWQERPPKDFIRAIRLALSAGAYRVARHLSAQGAEYYPHEVDLQKYARLLAPPQVKRSKERSDPTLKANRDWLMMHGDSFHGRWVALQNGELLGSAASLELLVRQVGETNGILLTKVY